MGDRTVAVFGATGFVGGAVAHALVRRGASVTALSAPRVVASVDTIPAVVSEYDIASLVDDVGAADVVVNAAGVADATGSDEEHLYGANAALPGILARVGERSGARLVHVSSAAVQGRRPVLDASDDADPTTTYARSKHLGEVMARTHLPSSVVYRPAGVHGPTRRVTRSLAAFARSPLSSVAAPGTANAPQALIDDVADAVAFLAMHPEPPPSVVTHPSSGITTRQLLEALGDGRRPRLVPSGLARAIVSSLTAAGRHHSSVGANARRLEVMWLGQAQDRSWLEATGWRPVTTHEGWSALAVALSTPHPQETEAEHDDTSY